MAGDGGRVPDVSEQRAEAIGAYLAQYPPSGFTERYSAAGWSHIARGVLSAAAVFAAEARDPTSVLAALLAESPEATVAAIEALLTSDEALEGLALGLEAEGMGFGIDDPTARASMFAVGQTAVMRACRSLLSKAPKGGGRMIDKPRADYVGHPAMDPGSYRVEYEGLYRRPGMEGLWCKRMEFWTESGRQCGAWRWAPKGDGDA